MLRRTKTLSGLLIAAALALVAFTLQSISAAATPGAGSPDGGGHANHGAKVSASGDDPDGDGYIPADPPVTGVEPSTKEPPHRYFHEFQANCSVSHTGPDDPIVYPGQPGASHHHTFMGNTTTDAFSTTDSLGAGGTTCKAPGDKSAYWMPTMFNGDEEIRPVGPQTIYYKSGVTDYTSVRPFPKGLRYVVGSPMQSADEFRNHPGWVEGWECGESYFNADFPESCPTARDVQVNVRFQSPSCWDGEHLDTPGHRSHMAYPVAGGANQNTCPASHPVAVPMIEFKMAFPVNGDLSELRLASGTGHSFHYDFFNAWDEPTLNAMVDHCIVGGLQCDARGYDQTHPERGAALDEDYELPTAAP
ncbi:DUF1996 domain-containing protein [Streptomyces sp. N2-109]|uniref:DUF1996 domain-containing protein n=1 Tax=Streptomyces gossypii TaxID=2883101 RepID=A0ABT2JM29_9ACTN|nr:DUF1996 domain-containing protein [Streptomyces gossypii]MCT2588942.1 DUF1996 domain-containing protein [Streptomyces gossypii]